VYFRFTKIYTRSDILKTTKSETRIISEENNSPLLYLLKGTSIAYAVTLIVFIVYSIILTYTDTTEENLSTVIMITVVVSVLISGFDTARGVKNKGLIWGLIAGFIYSAIMIIVGFCVVPDYKLSASSLINLILGLAGGGFGGIIGINTKKY
jgi:putative membrane protein (TIGR04086 family)